MGRTPDRRRDQQHAWRYAHAHAAGQAMTEFVLVLPCLILIFMDVLDLGRVFQQIVSDGRRVTASVNAGEPFVLTDSDATVSQNVYQLARTGWSGGGTERPGEAEALILEGTALGVCQVALVGA
jgi:hypothetical protein